MNESQPNALMQLIPLLIISVFFGFVVIALAKEKGRRVGLWALLGFMPIINFYLFWFFVGASNQRVERKIDALLSAQGSDPSQIR